jgi:heat shock protein HslJ
MASALLVRAVLALSLALAAQVVSGPRPLEGTYWKAIELLGRPVPSQASIREAYLLLQEGGRVYGSDGCNRVAGRYEVTKTGVRFDDMAVTRMACIDTGVAGERLELFDSANRLVAVILAVPSRPGEPGNS